MRAKSSVKLKTPIRTIDKQSNVNYDLNDDQSSTQMPSTFSSQQSLPKIINLPQTSCRSWGIYTLQDGQLIKGLNTTQIREMASITKIMTCLVCLRLLKKYNFDSKKLYFSVSQQASTTLGTSANLKYNEWYTVNDLLYGLMLPSGNDCALCLAENFGCILYFAKQGQLKMLEGIDSVDVLEDYYVGTYVQLFIKEMNALASEFKLKSTRFTNPHGLSDKMNRSTCNDLAILTSKSLQWHEFRKIVQAKYHVAYFKKFNVQNQQEYRNEWYNTNKLLDKGSYLGVKTGITNTAGACLSSHYCDYVKEINQEVNIIIIVLGSQKPEGRFDDTQTIVDWYIKQLKDGSL